MLTYDKRLSQVNSLTSCPPILTLPDFTSQNLAMILHKVVFPEPDGPTIAQVEFWGIFKLELYSDIKPNPTIENVKHGVEAFKASGADYLIAIGGGSSMDTSKAIGIIIANPEFEDVRSLEGTAPTKNPCVPIIAVPTTAGTAAEVTINYVITDVERKRKFV